VKVQEQFIVAVPASTVWEFFEQVDRVARCVPGVEEVTVVDEDNSKVRVTQAVGPMTATFDMKMRITAREPGRSIEFTAIGRSVRGAAGNVRSTSRVHLEDGEDGSTQVVLEGDVALGGMLGSVGQKVVAKQAGEVTRAFAQALQAELAGGGAAPGTPPTAAATPGATADSASPPGASAAAPSVWPAPGELPPAGSVAEHQPGVGGMLRAKLLAGAGALALGTALFLRRRRSR
jgi:carbon monoxide dehydrogenase subunit G